MNGSLILVAVTAVFVLSSCSGTTPVQTGLDNGKFFPCPDKPNCVSSMEVDSKHFIVPYSYTCEREVARSVLKEIVLSQPGATLKEELNDYLYAEFRSTLFGFIDDVEFSFPEDALRVDIRSASRKGYWDMGANRKRMEQIRKQFLSRLASKD